MRASKLSRAHSCARVEVVADQVLCAVERGPDALRATWQYCRYCLGSIATGLRSGHRPHALPDRRFVRDQLDRELTSMRSGERTRSRSDLRGHCCDARIRARPVRIANVAAPGANRERVAHDRGLNPGQSLAAAGCQSASRWQYCQAVSAVLPKVARRHPATPSSRNATEPPSSRNATGPPSSRDATVPPATARTTTTDDAYSRTT